MPPRRNKKFSGGGINSNLEGRENFANKMAFKVKSHRMTGHQFRSRIESEEVKAKGSEQSCRGEKSWDTSEEQKWLCLAGLWEGRESTRWRTSEKWTMSFGGLAEGDDSRHCPLSGAPLVLPAWCPWKGNEACVPGEPMGLWPLYPCNWGAAEGWTTWALPKSSAQEPRFLIKPWGTCLIRSHCRRASTSIGHPHCSSLCTEKKRYT